MPPHEPTDRDFDTGESACFFGNCQLPWKVYLDQACDKSLYGTRNSYDSSASKNVECPPNCRLEGHARSV